MYKFSRYFAALILLITITLTGCSEEKGTALNFDNADSPADK